MSEPKIIYYRWVYSPTTGDVTISHNHEGHPTDIHFHSDMAEDRPESDLLYGYAYRLDNGWKVTDHDHREVDDPNIVYQVVRQIVMYEKETELHAGAN